jgi:hypothetical protein
MATFCGSEGRTFGPIPSSARRAIVEESFAPAGGTDIKARIGDRLVLEGTHVGDDRRTGTIIEIDHPDGSPPYRVRWRDGHESFIIPGPEARVEPRNPDAETV